MGNNRAWLFHLFDWSAGLVWVPVYGTNSLSHFVPIHWDSFWFCRASIRSRLISLFGCHWSAWVVAHFLAIWSVPLGRERYSLQRINADRLDRSVIHETTGIWSAQVIHRCEAHRSIIEPMSTEHWPVSATSNTKNIQVNRDKVSSLIDWVRDAGSNRKIIIYQCCTAR